MDVFQNLFGARAAVPTSAFLSFTPLTPKQQQYLTSVYAILAASVLATAVGVYVSVTYFAFWPLLCFIGELGGICYVTFTSSPLGLKAANAPKRLVALLGSSFLLGMSLTSLLRYTHFLNPSILPMALLVTFTVFCSFSLAAMFARERQFLFLGSILSSVVSFLSILSLFSLFSYSRAAHSTLLYGGLFVYMGYVLVDTQAVLHHHSIGHTDAILHALTFYTNVINIFIRLVKILNEKEREKRRKR